ncbi:Stk1 family PASTA domain-containing Ser/Thr kinase [Clostridium sp. Marseille-P299]|uniref:Stk1 family PASTA domain-containing Ser/Thr kinase n=1 Tax=Clostridium sp. Marseille-P299 TaxID=1805477 RepID=UPI00082E4292|nr:Stk1 family PASTA domain-containing Ser/Thr kinase [Clostridium sp. Marseille-P299]
MIKPGMFISDRYEIIDKVGSGGMADVYKAKCHRLNRYVAIKILKPEYSNDKNFVTKFRGEAQSAAGLSHPNIVNVYDVGDDDGLYYIVMELVEGITLKKFIERKGKLEIKEAVGIAIQIAQGMEAAHDNHIIHRDIKPQNIIISRDGKVKVTDFGIAKAATSNTVTQNAIGSVHYLSPEQARGGYSDEKSDIYSLGVTLYEMLTGKVPFAGDNTVSVALLHIQGEAVPVRELNPEVPISLNKIVQKCMQKKPERRYLTASDLIKDLKRSLVNPDGDFVVLATSTITDSPTINLTDDEMNHIKSAAKTPVTLYDASVKEQASSKVQKEEEEELDSVDSRVEKVLVVGTVVTAVALGLVVLYFVFKFFGLFDIFGKKPDDVTPAPEVTITASPSPTPEISGSDVTDLVTVPRVVGLTTEDAYKALKERSENFQIRYAEEAEYSDEYDKDLVMKQYPPENTEVAPNSEIILTLSAGTEMVKLPNVYNLSQELATKTLKDLGLEVEVKEEANNDLSVGMVIRTNPARSDSDDNPVMVKKGSTVILYVSSGPDQSSMVAVPDILGMSEKDARKELERYGLILGNVTPEASNKYAEGLVSYQSTTPGLKVAIGSTIDVTISTGPDVTPTPTATPTPEPTIEPTSAPEQYRYTGRVKINENPFTEGDSGQVYFELEQDGEATEVATLTLGYDDFVNGYPLNIEGTKEGVGILRMYVDNTLYNSWSVELVRELVQ